MILVPPTTLLATSAIANFSESIIVINSPLESVLNDILFNATFSAIHAAGVMEMVTGEVETSLSIYEYIAPKRLWIAYGIAFAVAIINVSIGIWAVVRNKRIVENGFLQTIVVTRNPELDVLAASGGVGIIPDGLKKAKLTLGRLETSATFGTQGKVFPLK